ncbi:hypothetical protein DRO30_02575 [Candidatus Bathyarchaeota archaeon]|nr:MAG: hypothetical protein DRO30_02575 [Candidatus Bathyarchaeota archaeon]
MNETDKAWLAALIDGEGSIGIGHQVHLVENQKRSTFFPYISISNLNRPILEKAKELFQSGCITEAKGVYTFITKKQQSIYKVLKDIKPYLIIKKDHANLLLEYLEFNMINFGAPQGETHKEYYIKMRKLNLKRGQKLKLPKFYLQKQTRGLWISKEELERLYLQEELSLREIAQKLNVSKVSVWRALKRFNIKTRPKSKDTRSKSTYRAWTKEEDEFLRNNYTKMTDREIAQALNRTISSVFGRRWVLGLRK